jgi:lauroyl/myristoyl acyltransferase
MALTTAPPRWYAHPYNRPLFYRLAGAAGVLPRPARLGLAVRAADLAARLMPAERAVVRRTLARITGAPEGVLDGLTRAVFRNFAVCFADLVSTNRRPGRALQAHLARVTGAEHLRDLGGGLISLTAHLGNWELGGRLLAWHTGRPTHVVVAPDEAPGLERWLRRSGDGLRFVPRASATAAVNLLAALRRGEVVALQGDRALGGRSDVRVSFFGRPAPFPLGPFTLARACGVPIVPAFCVLEADRRYAITVGEPLSVKLGAEETALARWVGQLERAVRERPTQWFNFFDVWSAPGA